MVPIQKNSCFFLIDLCIVNSAHKTSSAFVFVMFLLHYQFIKVMLHQF